MRDNRIHLARFVAS